MRNNYKTGTKQMSVEEVFNNYFFYHKYSRLSDKYTSTPNRVKAAHFEAELNRRGYSDEEVTDMVNERLSIEYRESKTS